MALVYQRNRKNILVVLRNILFVEHNQTELLFHMNGPRTNVKISFDSKEEARSELYVIRDLFPETLTYNDLRDQEDQQIEELFNYSQQKTKALL